MVRPSLCVRLHSIGAGRGCGLSGLQGRQNLRGRRLRYRQGFLHGKMPQGFEPGVEKEKSGRAFGRRALDGVYLAFGKGDPHPSVEPRSHRRGDRGAPRR